MSIPAEDSAVDVGGGAVVGAGVDILTIVLCVEGGEHQSAVTENLKWGNRKPSIN